MNALPNIEAKACFAFAALTATTGPSQLVGAYYSRVTG